MYDLSEEDILIEIPRIRGLSSVTRSLSPKSKGLLEFLRAEEPSFTPLVRKIRLTLTLPSIEDNLSDLERVKRALIEKGIEGMRFSHGFVQQYGKGVEAS